MKYDIKSAPGYGVLRFRKGKGQEDGFTNELEFIEIDSKNTIIPTSSMFILKKKNSITKKNNNI